MIRARNVSKVYGIPARNSIKSLVWYSPKMFADKGYKIPTTLDELKALSDAAILVLTSRDDVFLKPRGPKMNGFLTIIRGCQDVIGTMLLGGVFERHPELPKDRVAEAPPLVVG